MKLTKLTAIIVILLMLAVQGMLCSAFGAENLKIKDIITDNSDRLIYIRSTGSFKGFQTATYAPIPNSNNSVNLINNITTFTISSPFRYVIDVPNATLIGASRNYKFQNSIIQNIALSQFSVNPNVVRIVFTVSKQSDLSKFKTYTNGTDIIVKYNSSIIDNSIQYKFYTPSGDSDKSAQLQNTSAVLTYNTSNDAIDITPRLQTKYYLSQISQNSDGLILRGLGQISMQRASYSDDNSTATVILDSASLSSKLENKTYNIPSSNKIKGTLTINRLNSRKIKLTLESDNSRDFRFVVSPDGQSLFVSHRTYVINTIFSTNTAKVNSYKMTKNSSGYSIFDIVFNQAVTYDVFELNDNFYLDVNNLGDYNILLFEQMLKSCDIKVTALKISQDKTRFIIPMKDLNFAYANVESNAKSIKLCFKEKPAASVNDKNEVVIASTKQNNEIKEEYKSGNINVVYIPKEDEKPKVEKPKKKKEPPTISSMKKVVIDPGHGGSDSGAIGGGYYEKTLNLAVAKLVQEKLEKKNIYVYMTRTKDVTMTLEDRVNYSNELSPDIYVSIHTNSTVKEDSYGLETHYYKDDSLELAQKIHSNFASEKNLKKWDTKDRGVIKSCFYVINHTEAPSVLIEMGFISNLEERAKLLTKNRQEQIADAIVKGILEYLK